MKKPYFIVNSRNGSWVTKKNTCGVWKSWKGAHTQTFTHNRTQLTSHTHTETKFGLVSFTARWFESVFVSFIRAEFVKITFPINASWLEVGQKHFVRLQPLVLSDTLAHYHTWQPDWWNMLCRLELSCLDTVGPIEHLRKAPLVFSYVSADKWGIVAERWGTPCWARLTGTTTRLCYQRQQCQAEERAFFCGALINLIV